MLVAVVAGLLVFAAVYDTRAKSRGTYRSAAEWHEITSRRKTVGRELRRRKSTTPDEDSN